MKHTNLIEHDLIQELLKYWHKGKTSEVENKLQEIRDILANWSQMLLFAVRIKMNKDYTQKEGQGFFSGLCKHLSIGMEKLKPHLKVTFVEIIEITKGLIWLEIKKPQLIPLTCVNYIDIRPLPTQIEKLEHKFTDTLVRKRIKLTKPPRCLTTSKNRQFFTLSNTRKQVTHRTSPE